MHTREKKSKERGRSPNGRVEGRRDGKNRRTGEQENRRRGSNSPFSCSPVLLFSQSESQSVRGRSDALLAVEAGEGRASAGCVPRRSARLSESVSLCARSSSASCSSVRDVRERSCTEKESRQARRRRRQTENVCRQQLQQVLHVLQVLQVLQMRLREFSLSFLVVVPSTPPGAGPLVRALGRQEGQHLLNAPLHSHPLRKGPFQIHCYIDDALLLATLRYFVQRELCSFRLSLIDGYLQTRN